ncbi:hypothetical protein FXB38_22235 [Bradyrhizobium cytisi]|uniref:Uncharacterized protein n=1 Tax=Bradyrhizobium cytisi TaxID=515489 RepID=A0A5S4WHZ7_9BRAD|nr:hypothetical protein FXB38_22235 [Bradyrhizobium cytisi]
MDFESAIAPSQGNPGATAPVPTKVKDAGAERHALLQKARDGDAAADIERLPPSPTLQHPK